MKLTIPFFLGSCAIAIVLAGSAHGQKSYSKEEIDRNCIISSGDMLRQLTGLNATAGRAQPLLVEGQAKPNPDYRLVELDTTNVGMKVTYVFMCVRFEDQFKVSPMGHR